MERLRTPFLVDQQDARYKAWFAAMDLAGVERRLFAWSGGNLHRASWNPIRLSHHATQPAANSPTVGRVTPSPSARPRLGAWAGWRRPT